MNNYNDKEIKAMEFIANKARKTPDCLLVRVGYDDVKLSTVEFEEFITKLSEDKLITYKGKSHNCIDWVTVSKEMIEVM